MRNLCKNIYIFRWETHAVTYGQGHFFVDTTVKSLQIDKRASSQIFKPMTANKARSKGKNELTDDQRAEIEDAFHLLDVDGDGLISTHDIKIALRAIGFEPTKKEILHMIDDADAAAKGQISLPVFMRMMTKKRDDMNPDEEIRRAFRLFCDEGSNGIRIADIKRVSLELGESLTDEEIKDILEEADRDNDGVISYDEFVYVMRKTSMF